MGSTFYDGGNSEMQSSADGGLQTLYLMNPTTTYVPYSDTTSTSSTSTHHHPNMLLLNPNALNLPTLSHAPPPPPHQHLLGLTIPTTHHHNHQDMPSFHYNLWPSPSSILDHHPIPSSPSTPSAAAATFRRPTPHHPQQQQPLSLSLSPNNNYNRSLSGDFSKPRSPTTTTTTTQTNGEDIEIPSNWSVVLGSKYLKAAQEVLDEVVNVGKGIIDHSLHDMDASNNNNKDNIIKSQSQSPTTNITADPSSQPELTTAQTQELQMKKSKLLHMLDEVEQRYRQYRQQMQIVICSFEQAAGFGAAKSYTAVALRTISKQFRCLKDAISSQIKATSKSLGEDYDFLGGKIEGSRLRYVDHHLRQQRALQQLGMIQHNAWRPQRGLPERAVSILRAWLFEHFLHPYPKDSDKVMLAKQTGLTRSQVSNWFINARVRLWKPMVEEMYLEETKEQQGEDQEQNINNNYNNNGASNSSKDISSKDQSIASNNNNNNNNNNMNGPVVMVEESSSGGGGNNMMNMMRSLDEMKALQSKSDHHHQRFSINQTTSSSSNSGMGLMGSAGGGIGNNINNVSVMDVEMKPVNNNKYINVGVGGGTNYAGFSMQDIGRFNINNDNHNNNGVSDHQHHQQQHLAPRFHGNGVSLTLGLPHSNNDHHNQLPLSLSAATQHGFLSHHHHRNIHLGSNNNNGSSSSDQFCAITATPPPSQSSHHNSAGTATYDNIDIQNTKNFAAQLLPDFVT